LARSLKFRNPDTCNKQFLASHNSRSGHHDMWGCV
jgi:hypothetical protein